MTFCRIGLLFYFFLCIALFGNGQQIDTFNCARSEPSPVLAERKCKTWLFQLRDQKKQGMEYAKLLNGDSVTIQHTGCDSYELEFVYFFKYPDLPNDAKRDWSAKLIEALEQLRLSGLETINLKKYQEILTNEIDKAGFLLDKKSYSAEDFVVKEKISLEERGRLADLQFYKFSISIGPL